MSTDRHTDRRLEGLTRGINKDQIQGPLRASTENHGSLPRGR